MKMYSAAIIGAGSIGALKPNEFDSPKTMDILTIAHAMYINPKIDLKYIIDTDKKKSIQAGDKWDIPYRGFSIDYLQNNLDIVAVCTPTETHYEVLKKLVSKSPKLVIAEKPFCSTLEEAKSIHKIYNEAGIPLVIDYIRRFDGVTQMVKNNFIQEKIHSCTLHYTRGIVHEACHAIDLFNYFFGKLEDIKICSYDSGIIIDRSKEDPTFPVYLSYEKCPNVFLIPCDGEDYAIFEIDICTNLGRYRFINHGSELEHFKVLDKDDYGNYSSIEKHPVRFITGLKLALSSLIKNCIDILEDNALPICSSNDAILVHTIYKEMAKIIHKEINHEVSN